MAKYGFDWVEDTLSPAIDSIDDQADAFLTAVVEFHAPQAEAQMKREAPWTDQTSNARNALFATTERKRPIYRIILGHGVPYGIWLEVRWAGRYAILEPTIQSQGREVMKTVQEGFMRGLIKG